MIHIANRYSLSYWLILAVPTNIRSAQSLQNILCCYGMYSELPRNTRNRANVIILLLLLLIYFEFFYMAGIACIGYRRQLIDCIQ
jgi:hypothetical protein